MSNTDRELADKIIAKALECGAGLAGIANVAEVKQSPSHKIFGKLDAYNGVGTKDDGPDKKPGVAWPDNAKSVIIIAVRHPEDQPRLDWWRDGFSGGTEGNRALMDINNRLGEWLKGEGIDFVKHSYHIEHGGIFLKDSAVLAGLGILGKINILVTPQYGTLVRLRAITIDRELPSTGMLDWDPCEDCPMPCRTACPQNAFGETTYEEVKWGQKELPARDGTYSRVKCNMQMEINLKDHTPIEVKGQDEPGKLVDYCRICEMACIACDK